MISVIVHERGGRAQRVAFTGDTFSVGREDDNDVVLDRANVSKHHLRLRRIDGTVEVVDLDSTNGTYVNGRRIDRPRAVRRPDRIYVGDYILLLDGDDIAIRPAERLELQIPQADGTVSAVPVALPGGTPNRGEPVTTRDDSSLMTSARRVGRAGTDSTYIDRIASKVLSAVLGNVRGLDPLHAAEPSEADITQARTLVRGLLRELQARGELQEGVDIEPIIGAVERELTGLGPLQELMHEEDLTEIQVVGAAPIRIQRKIGNDLVGAVIDRRFSGDRALVLAIHRLAREWGFLVEGTQVLEGKVGEGYSMYALLPPTAVRSPVLNLRRTRTDANNLQALVQEGVLSGDMRDVISACIRGSRKVLVCASGGANLDRFMGALLGEVPDSLRVACISDTGRLGMGRRGWVQVRRIADPADAVSLSDSLGLLLRGGLDMLISQRCRHEDAAAVIDAMSGAAQGAIVSLWGIDSAHALSRLAALSTVASGAINALTVALARSVDLLIRLGVGVNGEAMQVVELIEPRVHDQNQIIHEPIFRAEQAPDGSTRFVPTGTVPYFAAALERRGVSLPKTIFGA